MVDYILKYGTGNLIIICCCIYFRLLHTIRDIIWNSMELIRGTESGSQVNK